MNTNIIKIPELGNYHDVEVIEVCVKPGDLIEDGTILLVLETDKATMEIPSTVSGKVIELYISHKQKVNKGDCILSAELSQEINKTAPASTPEPLPLTPQNNIIKPAESPINPQQLQEKHDGLSSAGPAARKLARELGIGLTAILGTGNRGRITLDDVKKSAYKQIHVKDSSISNSKNTRVLPDFKEFGAYQTIALSGIKKKSADFLAETWRTIPHVTHVQEVDLTELEIFRQEHKELAQQKGVKLSPLFFIMKALVASLKAFPNFNASYDETTTSILVKDYYNLGVAVDTPTGLVVPVIKGVDTLSILELAQLVQDKSLLAKQRGLRADDYKGHSFTVSSLGGIGGSMFTPIINWPDVAILGIPKIHPTPKVINGNIEIRQVVSLCLSYDHRVIDGAEAARFMLDLAKNLEDLRRVLL